MKRERYKYSNYPPEGVAGIDRDFAMELACAGEIRGEYFISEPLVYTSLSPGEKYTFEDDFPGFVTLASDCLYELDLNGSSKLDVVEPRPFSNSYQARPRIALKKENVVFWVSDLERAAVRLAKKAGNQPAPIPDLQQRATQHSTGDERPRDITLAEAFRLARSGQIKTYVYLVECRWLMSPRFRTRELSYKHTFRGFLELPDYCLLDLEMTGRAVVEEIRREFFQEETRWKAEDDPLNAKARCFLEKPITVSIEDIVFKAEEINRVTAQAPNAASKATDEIFNSKLLDYLKGESNRSIRTLRKLLEAKEWRALFDEVRSKTDTDSKAHMQVRLILESRGGLNPKLPDVGTIKKTIQSLNDAEKAVKST